MSSPINKFSSQYHQRIYLIKLICTTKAEKNQVVEVRLIPGLKLFHFREYGPM